MTGMNMLENDKDWAISSQDSLVNSESKVQRLVGNDVDHECDRNSTPTKSGEDIVYSSVKTEGLDICYVYRITCIETNKAYIGISNDVTRRFKEHLDRGASTKLKLGRAIGKYGKDKFVVETILKGTRSYCAYMETVFIKELNTYEAGYNSSLGGEGSEFITPWNKNTKGVCMPNKTSFVKGGSSPRRVLTAEQVERAKNEFLSGIPPKEMDWLPVHWSQVYRNLKKFYPELKEFSLKQKMDLELAEKFLELQTKGWTQRAIAKHYNVNFQLVSQYLKKLKAARLTNGSNEKT